MESEMIEEIVRENTSLKNVFNKIVEEARLKR
jgi:hypothetical protein